MGISFAIPIDVAMNVAEQLKNTGKVQRGQLGVIIQEVSYGLAQSFGLDKASGALIAKILPGSPQNVQACRQATSYAASTEKKYVLPATFPSW